SLGTATSTASSANLSRSTISSFAGATHSSNPTLVKEHSHKANYGTVPGRLFVNGVKGTDYVQRNVGNCWLVSGCSAVAQKKPEIIQGAFTTHKNGTVSVRFYVPDDKKASGFKQVTVNIDRQVPLKGGNFLYGRGQDKRELWPALLEKAA